MDIKITGVDLENLKKGMKRGTLILMTAGMMMSLTGCMNVKERNKDNDTFIEMMQDERHDTSFYSAYSNISDENLEYLSPNLEILNLSYCTYISDLSILPERCPNLKEIIIDCCPSVTDFSFLFRLEHLEKVEITESAFVSRDLVDQLNKYGIKHNITESMLEDAETIDQILAEIITLDMTQEEKIQKITSYVIENYKYRVTKLVESNEEPLSSTLKNKGGVCASYAYLANQLYRKAGIESFETINKNHAWNIINLDGKYYYIDTTNIKQIPFVSKALLKYFNVGFFYMVDPDADALSAMDEYDSGKIIIPESLIEDIKRGEDEKTIFEKYQGSVPITIIEAIMAVMIISGAVIGINKAKEEIEYANARRREEARRKREEERKKRERNSRTGRTSYY